LDTLGPEEVGLFSPGTELDFPELAVLSLGQIEMLDFIVSVDKIITGRIKIVNLYSDNF
jgi:hypothetical protein